MNELHNVADTYVILDLDRTLLDTDGLTLAYERIIRERNELLADALMSAKREEEAKGDSFDLHQFIKSYLTPEEIDFCDDQLVERARSDGSLINSGGRELLGKLKQWNIAHGIVTYGHDSWQRLKLRASGMDELAHMVTSDSHKGRLIRGWQQPGGEFHMPRELVAQEMGSQAVFQTLILVDDKAVSFEDLPMNVTGFWYKPTEKLLKSQEGTVPADVLQIRHLGEVASDLQRRFDLAA